MLKLDSKSRDVYVVVVAVAVSFLSTFFNHFWLSGLIFWIAFGVVAYRVISFFLHLCWFLRIAE